MPGVANAIKLMMAGTQEDCVVTFNCQFIDSIQ